MFRGRTKLELDAVPILPSVRFPSRIERQNCRQYAPYPGWMQEMFLGMFLQAPYQGMIVGYG